MPIHCAERRQVKKYTKLIILKYSSLNFILFFSHDIIYATLVSHSFILNGSDYAFGWRQLQISRQSTNISSPKPKLIYALPESSAQNTSPAGCCKEEAGSCTADSVLHTDHCGHAAAHAGCSPVGQSSRDTQGKWPMQLVSVLCTTGPHKWCCWVRALADKEGL